MNYIYETSPAVAFQRLMEIQSGEVGVLILIGLFLLYKTLSILSRDVAAIRGKLSQKEINSLWISFSLFIVIVVLVYLSIAKGLLLFPNFFGYIDLSAQLVAILVVYATISFLITTVRAFYAGLKGDAEDIKVKKGGIITSILLALLIIAGVSLNSAYTEAIQKYSDNNQTLSK